MRTVSLVGSTEQVFLPFLHLTRMLVSCSYCAPGHMAARVCARAHACVCVWQGTELALTLPRVPHPRPYKSPSAHTTLPCYSPLAEPFDVCTVHAPYLDTIKYNLLTPTWEYLQRNNETGAAR
ncbi:hypothetical protein T492DRAFT_994858 [Pavlovales sp. CCMP2436]|nr:hypothetical protein T492DRAFT_994858 [Pavlovales sp. CCMP2436]